MRDQQSFEEGLMQTTKSAHGKEPKGEPKSNMASKRIQREDREVDVSANETRILHLSLARAWRLQARVSRGARIKQ